MVGAKRARDWLDILAAMAYLALFLAAIYGLGMFVAGAPFVTSFLSGLLPAFGACAVFFAGSAAIEAWQAAVKRTHEAPRTQYSLHH